MASLLSLDVGTKRIGVAKADLSVPIAFPLTTLEVDGTEIEAIKKLVRDHNITKIISGFPRNQSGNATEQTALVETFMQQLEGVAPIEYQDESLTSVMAEDRLKASGKPYEKGDIDALAATIILQDYLELHHAA